MGIFLMGLSVLPLTAQGVMVDGRRLCGCLWSWCQTAVPATQISAPESGRTFTIACLFREDMCTLIVGAGSKDRGAMVGVTKTIRAPGVKGVRGGDGFCGAFVRGSRHLRQALAKWPIF